MACWELVVSALAIGGRELGVAIESQGHKLPTLELRSKDGGGQVSMGCY